MKKGLIIVLLFWNGWSWGQVTFQKTYGRNGSEQGNSVRQTVDGGYIIAGSTTSFGSSAYLIKTSATGDTLWTKAFGVGDSRSVQQTSDGGYIIVGSTFTGDFDTYLIKTDGNGDSLWTKTYGETGGDFGESVQQTADGGYIIAGYTASFGVGNWDVYLIKTDSLGDILWSKTFGGTGDDKGYAVQQTTDGGYIIAGYTSSFGAGFTDVYLIKTNANGNILWTKTLGGTSNDDGNSIQQTTDGGYIIAGNTSSFGAGNWDVYLIKTDSTGVPLWSKTFGKTSPDYGYSVQQTTDGGYIIAGYTASFGAGNWHVYLIKADSIGDILWSKTFGGTGDDQSYAVKQTPDGGYIISGLTHSFGWGGGDVYLIKTDSFGNSGCNQTNPATIVTTPATTVTSPATIVTSAATVVTTPATYVGSVGVVSTLCTSVGINAIDNVSSTISIYPNPAHTNFTVSLNDGQWTIDNGQLRIYDVIGREVYQQGFDKLSLRSVSGTSVTEPVEVTVNCQLNAGIYFVRAGDAVQKLVVE